MRMVQTGQRIMYTTLDTCHFSLKVGKHDYLIT
jgi:hypothetical protein